MNAFFALALGFALSLQCLAGPAERLLEGVSFDQHLGALVPLKASLTDETGATVRLDDFVGPQPALLVLAYYNCLNVCGTMIGELAARLGELDLHPGRDFQVVVISFDPADTALIARARKARYGTAVDAWHFLTAPAATLDALTRAVGFRYKREADTAAFIHPAGAVILTPEGRVSRYAFALDPDTSALRYGLIEASHHRLGTPLDRLWLLCHSFDPASGRYTSLVTNIERGVGLASAGLLVGFVGWLTRQRRTKR